MKRLGLEEVYEWGLLWVLFVIVLHAPLSVGLGQLFPDYAAPIKAWKEVLFALLAVIGAVVVTRRQLWRPILSSRLVQLALGFMILHGVLAVFTFHNLAMTLAGLLIDLRFIAVFVLMYGLILLRPAAINRLMKVVAAGAVIVVGFGVLQITVLPDDILSHIGYSDSTIAPYITIDRNPDFVRINSTLRGPNPLGGLMVVYIALIAAYVVRKRAGLTATRLGVSIGAVAASIAVLFASFSRSAYAAAIVAPLVAVMTSQRLSKRVVAVVVGSVVMMGVVLAIVSSTSWFSNVVLHVNPTSTVASKSDSAHLASLKSGAAHITSMPFGGGIGSTGSASLYDHNQSNDFIVENEYFFVAHESGWVGLILFVLLFGGTLVALYRRRANWVALGTFAAGIGLVIIGVLLPVYTDDTLAIVWWALAGAAVVAPKRIMEARHE